MAEVAGDDRADRRTDVNAHVEDGISPIATDVGTRIELTDNDRNVGLEEAGSDDDERQCKPEYVDHRVGLAEALLTFEGHQEMAEGQEHGTEGDRLALPKILVGQIAAQNRRDVDQRGVSAIDDGRIFVIEKPMLRQVENQQRAHAVIGKTLPHLGEEQDVKTLGMAGEFLLSRRYDGRSADQQQNEKYSGYGDDDFLSAH